MKQLCAATHESGSGTFRTCRDVRLESGMRTKADIPPCRRHAATESAAPGPRHRPQPVYDGRVTNTRRSIGPHHRVPSEFASQTFLVDLIRQRRTWRSAQ